MSPDTRTERRQARHRRNLVIGSVVGLASVLSAALVGVLLVVGPGEPPSAARPVGSASSDWSGAGDDVWSDDAPPTSVATSTATVTTVTTGATGTPDGPAGSSEPAATAADAVTSTTSAPRRTAVTVVRTAARQPPAPTSPSPRPTASTSATTDLPPGQLKRPKPKTPPPPRR